MYSNPIDMILNKILNFLIPQKGVEIIKIHRKVLENAAFMAKSTYPNEFVAFFSGSFKKGVVEIDSLLLQSFNAGRTSAHFNITNMPLSSSILGTIHSHPSNSNRPSSTDKRLFNKKGLFHAIIKYPFNLGDISFYNKYGDEINIKII